MDNSSRSCTVPGKYRQLRTVAVEDVRPALLEGILENSVQEVIDFLDELLVDITYKDNLYNKDPITEILYYDISQAHSTSGDDFLRMMTSFNLLLETMYPFFGLKMINTTMEWSIGLNKMRV